jgi:hypothetical protein
MASSFLKESVCDNEGRRIADCGVSGIKVWDDREVIPPIISGRDELVPPGARVGRLLSVYIRVNLWLKRNLLASRSVAPLVKKGAEDRRSPRRESGRKERRAGSKFAVANSAAGVSDVAARAQCR